LVVKMVLKKIADDKNILKITIKTSKIRGQVRNSIIFYMAQTRILTTRKPNVENHREDEPKVPKRPRSLTPSSLPARIFSSQASTYRLNPSESAVITRSHANPSSAPQDLSRPAHPTPRLLPPHGSAPPPPPPPPITPPVTRVYNIAATFPLTPHRDAANPCSPHQPTNPRSAFPDNSLSFP
jgi:hypothetical protein